MVKLILNAAILLSLGVVLYVVVKALPRIEESDNNSSLPEEHWAGAYIEKIDVYVKSLAEKSLRRMRVWLLRFDNYVSKKLNAFRRDEKRENKPNIMSETEEERRVGERRKEERRLEDMEKSSEDQLQNLN